MKSGASKVKEFFTTRLSEIFSFAILVILTVIIFLAIPNLYYALVVEAILVVTLPAIIILSRRAANRNARKEVDKLLRVGENHQRSRPVHQDQSRYTSPGYVDIGPVADHGQPVSVMISAAEIMHDDDVRKRRYYGKIGGPFNEFPAISRFAEFLSSAAEVKSFGSRPSLDQVFEKETLQFFEKVRQEIAEISGENVQLNYDEVKTSFVFEFPKDGEYAFLTGVVLNLLSNKNIVIEGILSKYQPFSLTLHKTEFEKENKYTVISSFSIVKEGVLAKEEFKQILEENYNSIDHLMIDKKYVTGSISDINNLSNFLGVVKKLSSELLRIDIGILDIEELKCLNCGQKLNVQDTECTSCGAKRPYCRICRLALHPSEEEDIVQTPCCGIYAHKLHMIMWLDNHKKCPNCKKTQTKWLDQLKDSY